MLKPCVATEATMKTERRKFTHGQDAGKLVLALVRFALDVQAYSGTAAGMER